MSPKATDPGFVKQSDLLVICAYFDIQTETLYHNTTEYLIHQGKNLDIQVSYCSHQLEAKDFNMGNLL